MDGNNGEHVDLGNLAPVKSTGNLLRPVPNRERACAQCACSAKEGRDLVCRFDPPKVFGFMVPTVVPVPGRPGQMQQALEYKSYTQFPVVQPDQNCHKFEPRGG